MDSVMPGDRFDVRRQAGEVLQSCVRRAECALTWRGRPVADSSSPRGRGRQLHQQGQESEPGQPVPLLQQAGPPSVAERAFVQVLPCYPEAYRAVVKFMRELVGVSFPGLGEGGGNGGSEQVPVQE